MLVSPELIFPPAPSSGQRLQLTLISPPYSSKVVSGLMSLTCLVLNVCYLSDEALAVLHGGSQQLTQAWRVFCPPAIIMHLYVSSPSLYNNRLAELPCLQYLSWGQLQAYLVGLRDGNAELCSARLANGIFLGLGGGMFIAMVVSDHVLRYEREPTRPRDDTSQRRADHASDLHRRSPVTLPTSGRTSGSHSLL